MGLPLKLDTLVEDIYDLFDPNKDHELSEENLEDFCDTLRAVFRQRLAKQQPRDSVLRFSSLGKKDRQLWYEAHPDEDHPPEELTAQTYYKFLFGDIIEATLLFLAKEAGHSVERQQEEIEVDGIKGHIDAIIDGVVVDVKSASPFSFTKFKSGKIFEEDPFGYVHQLSGYTSVLTPGEQGAWLVQDKVSGALQVTYLPTSIIADNLPAERIEFLKEVIKPETEIPERCYEDIPDGKSGNRKLATPCSYCAFKRRCWPGTRTFLYSTGPRYLTKVVKTPEVYEVNENQN